MEDVNQNCFCVAESERRYRELERKYQDLAGQIFSPAN
jgi:hypothetical protein